MSGLRGLRSPKPPSGERRRQAKAYQGALEAVFAVVIAAGLGYWLDGRFESSPIGLFQLPEVAALLGSSTSPWWHCCSTEYLHSHANRKLLEFASKGALQWPTVQQQNQFFRAW